MHSPKDHWKPDERTMGAFHLFRWKDRVLGVGSFNSVHDCTTSNGDRKPELLRRRGKPSCKELTSAGIDLLLLLDAFDDWPVNVFICFMWGDSKDIFVKMWLVACLLFSPQTYFLECLVESKILKISRTWTKGLREYLFISIFISYLLSPDSTIFSLSKMFSLTFSQKLNNEWTDE